MDFDHNIINNEPLTVFVAKHSLSFNLVNSEYVTSIVRVWSFLFLQGCLVLQKSFEAEKSHKYLAMQYRLCL